MKYKEHVLIILVVGLIILDVYYIGAPLFWRKCLPDLLVENYTANYVGGHYNVDVTVINDGCAKSGECLVYCNAISMTPPVGENEIRAQQSRILEELQPGETATCSFLFAEHMLSSEAVGVIEILVDAKVMVEESNENNNIEWWTV